MNEEQPRVIYVRAGAGRTEKADLAGLIGRIMREALTSSSQYFVLQLAYDQDVLSTAQAWKTLKQVAIKQNFALVVSGGSDEVRAMADSTGFPLIGTADTVEASPPDLEQIRVQISGYSVPDEMANLSFDQLVDDYRTHEKDSSLRTVGGFIEFIRQHGARKN
ncbi:MAG TPA: hypothetical protein VH186_21820 [Chloroflexia bacterium]|nr:hypothetical protein [Chloroflexia bacterium]